jgi:hypothetical protein
MEILPDPLKGTTILVFQPLEFSVDHIVALPKNHSQPSLAADCDSR